MHHRDAQAGHRSAEGMPEARGVAAGIAGGVSREGGTTFRDRKTAEQVREGRKRKATAQANT